MRIQTIEVTNYKAFLGTHKINMGGKNVFIYGENGSGKSSLYYAMKDFFQSSIENIDISELENIFVHTGMKGKTKIKLTFKPNNLGQNRTKKYLWNKDDNDTRIAADTSIRDANRLKSFLTYKHLLIIHYLKKDERINLFDLLVKGVLKHFKYSLTGGKELGELWSDVEQAISRSTSREYPINKKKTDVKAATKIFNEAFRELFNPGSPEHVLKYAIPILNYFNHNIDLNLHFPQVRPNNEYSSLEGADVQVELTYAGMKIDKPHMFLNEARLSAIAISIYLGMIKRHIQGVPCKVLFLDDIFIGLDISNRMPLLNILEAEFADYQIFISTYDRPWYEYAKGFLEQKPEWKTMEFYAQPIGGGIDIPLIFDDLDFIAKAESHLNLCDYKSAAVYTRSAFEKIIRKHCEKNNKKLIFKSRIKDYSSEDFWSAIKNDIPGPTKDSIETYRALVLNALSHYNTDRHEIKPELENAIQAVKDLKSELGKL